MKKPLPARKQSETVPPRRLRGWKRWAFPLAAMLLVPGLFFVLIELFLRAVDYGFPTKFLIKQEVAGETVYTENRKYGWRFFPPQVARRPARIMLPATKPADTFRVFVFGESAAMGDPDPAYGISRILEVMLSERFPSVEFEVVNAAMTGINSHVVRDIARDCAKFEPDCFIIYMGNNEAIGPYGPGTVFASFSRYLPLTRLSIGVRSLKISQWIEAMARPGSEEPDGWGGLRVFMKSQLHPSDRRVALMGDHFEANLKAICNTGRKAGAKLVLCTVAANLADCSPFASMTAPSLTIEEERAWHERWALAERLEAEGRIEEALKAFQEAGSVDPSHAELHFRKGGLLAALGRAEEARESFIRANVNDALRFRASSDLNLRVKRVAETFSDSQALLADVAKAIEEDSGGAGAGSNHFFDHVHFKFRGNYVAALEMFEAVSRFVLDSGRAPADTATVLSEDECAERLAFTPWNRMRTAEHMLMRLQIPPFSSKSDSAQRLREYREELARLKDADSPAALAEALAVHDRALRRRPSDPDLLRRLAELHGELEQSAEEIKYRKRLYELIPYDEDNKAYLAEVHSRSGDYMKGERFAREVLKDDPGHALARLALGQALERQGRVGDAIAEYREVLRWRPDLAMARYRLDELLHRGGRPFDSHADPPGFPTPAAEQPPQ